MPFSGLDIVTRLAIVLGIIAIPLLFAGIRAAWSSLRTRRSEKGGGPASQLH